MSSTSDKVIYQHDVIEFAQVAVQFCAQLERANETEHSEFIDKLLKLIPLLYMKAQLLPEVESDGDFLPDDFVTEQDYNFVLTSVAQQLGDDDMYLDIVTDEMLQTDDTQWKRVSEHLADAYQPLRNFLAAYQRGVEECMHDALWALHDSFAQYWGEALTSALLRLHRIKYTERQDSDDDVD